MRNCFVLAGIGALLLAGAARTARTRVALPLIFFLATTAVLFERVFDSATTGTTSSATVATSQGIRRARDVAVRKKLKIKGKPY